MIIITGRPVRTHRTNPLVKLRWNSVSHPMVYTMQRKDYTIGLITNNGSGYASLTISPNTDIAVGDKLYADGNGYFPSGIYTVTAKIVQVGQDLISIDAPYTSMSLGFGGYVNNLSREGYHVSVEVIVYEAVSKQEKSLGRFKYAGSADGKIIVDISNQCNRFLKALYSEYNQTLQVNQRQDYCWGRAYINYEERYDGGTYFPASDISEQVYFTLSAKYMQEKYGQNLGEYTPVAISGLKAKFLSDFKSPTWFSGYPFTLSFIYSELIDGQDITCEEDELDQNKSVVNHLDWNIDQSQAVGENIFSPIGVYTGNTKFVDLWLRIGSVAVRRYVAEGYVADG